MKLPEFSKLIEYCIQQYELIPFCAECRMKRCYRCNSNDCYECLRHIHNIHTTDEHYSCIKITYNYILKFGHRYASEIGKSINHLKKYLDLTSVINVLSVGCGPSTELYGVIAALPDSKY